MKVLSVVGARPQFVKAGPVSRALRREHDEVLVHTGQHYDEEMSDVFFTDLGIPEPDYNLGVGSAGHAEQTAAMMTALSEVVDEEDPDYVLVYGDTNSTLAAALVAAKGRARIAHVEAGLRSYDRSMPEEVNRVLTDHAAHLLFPPTENAKQILEGEGIIEGVHVTGDVMYDTLLWAREKASTTIVEDLGLTEGEYILATVHRASNTDDPERLEAIVDALGDAPLPVVLPVHPRTENALKEHGLWERAQEAMRIVDPVGYLEFIALLDGAERMVTDSGGVQKEAFFLDTPCVTLREETEWTETVDAGYNVLVGVDEAAIREQLSREFGLDPATKPTPYGDGNAAEEITRLLEADAREHGLLAESVEH
jgi:UDP-GlcNAc3NAcA epimerase